VHFMSKTTVWLSLYLEAILVPYFRHPSRCFVIGIRPGFGRVLALSANFAFRYCKLFGDDVNLKTTRLLLRHQAKNPV
jgi:hypothetical protein